MQHLVRHARRGAVGTQLFEEGLAVDALRAEEVEQVEQLG
jgi:hypothetical protein